ncbi:hypothetical protein B9Z19DRAFT_124383 [Tuber borchii]|uniref:Uncharacterized protein n=1 Tax=Tuber borchii TaxID=42251 RepID=A0A2T6ZRA6_TUBBO|nr:hypothetical protein B9Z19DRAFT_124383 [Tuber borchii]
MGTEGYLACCLLLPVFSSPFKCIKKRHGAHVIPLPAVTCRISLNHVNSSPEKSLTLIPCQGNCDPITTGGGKASEQETPLSKDIQDIQSLGNSVRENVRHLTKEIHEHLC